MDANRPEVAKEGRTFDSAYSFSFSIALGLLLFLAGLVISPQRPTNLRRTRFTRLTVELTGEGLWPVRIDAHAESDRGQPDRVCQSPGAA